VVGGVDGMGGADPEGGDAATMPTCVTRRLAAGVLAVSSGYSDAFPPKDVASSVHLVREQ